MREIPLTATLRQDTGKGAAHRARQSGNIPAVIYGPEIDSIPIEVEEREFRSVWKAAGGSSIVNLKVDGKENKVIVRDIQRDPITNRVIHLDFHAISMTKPISISIPIIFTGTPVGVKVDGGIMQATMRELDISCLPTDIPEHFEIDVSNLSIGDSIHVSNLSIPNVQIEHEPASTVVVISAPTVVKSEAAEGTEGEAEAAAEGEEAKEGEAAAEGEGAKDEGKASK